MDSSFINPHASNDSAIHVYEEFTRGLDGHPFAAVNRQHLSTTDPDASLVRAHGNSRLRYKTHRAVDPSGLITAVGDTPGVVNEAHRLLPLLESHEENTVIKAATVVADSKYGTTGNLLACHDRGVLPCMSPPQKRGRGRDPISIVNIGPLCPFFIGIKCPLTTGDISSHPLPPRQT